MTPKRRALKPCITCGAERHTYNQLGPNSRAVCSRECDSAYKKTLYDSGRCKSQYYVKKTPTIKGNCLYCGAPFVTFWPHKKYCSERCTNFYNYKIRGIRYDKPYTPVIRQTRPCAYCGRDFAGRCDAKYCCAECHRRSTARKYRQRSKHHNRVAAEIMRQLLGKDKVNALAKNIMKARPVPRFNGSDMNALVARLLNQLIGKDQTNDLVRHFIESH